jgi:hypothetical protein
MKREVDVSEEESALLIELLEEDQHRLNAEKSRAPSQDRTEHLRRQLEVTRKVANVLSRKPNQVWCEEFLAWSSPR